MGTEDTFSPLRAVTLFILSAVVVRVISYEGQEDRTVKEVSN